jgi:4'-phosphopantetheinyl transferase EntD
LQNSPCELTEMIDRILPSLVQSAEEYGDSLDAHLHEDERDLVANAVPARRREFATGRTCARRAMRHLGHPAVAIGRGEMGNPLWPAGLVGSITHCEGYRAAAVAPAKSILTIGIDSELRLALPRGLLTSIATALEVRQVMALTEADPATPWDRLLFSAKEAIYKAWFGLHRETRGFKEVVVRIDSDGDNLLGWVKARGLQAPTACIAGRWMLTEWLILTAVAPCLG